ncbi:hypothetical protein HanPI659440_Chr13g0497441 [Helianthus annuus]|nr:hypothetical protein HanPI659440_Chr13g0497441 [Helianthus annuus]
MNNNSLSGPIPPEISRLPMLVHILTYWAFADVAYVAGCLIITIYQAHFLQSSVNCQDFL